MRTVVDAAQPRVTLASVTLRLTGEECMTQLLGRYARDLPSYPRRVLAPRQFWQDRAQLPSRGALVHGLPHFLA